MRGKRNDCGRGALSHEAPDPYSETPGGRDRPECVWKRENRIPDGRKSFLQPFYISHCGIRIAEKKLNKLIQVKLSEEI